MLSPLFFCVNACSLLCFLSCPNLRCNAFCGRFVVQKLDHWPKGQWSGGGQRGNSFESAEHAFFSFPLSNVRKGLVGWRLPCWTSDDTGVSTWSGVIIITIMSLLKYTQVFLRHFFTLFPISYARYIGLLLLLIAH